MEIAIYNLAFFSYHFSITQLMLAIYPLSITATINFAFFYAQTRIGHNTIFKL